MQREDQSLALSTQLLPQKDRGMQRSPEMSPRRLSDISPQLRQLKSLVVVEEIKEELKFSRSVEDIKNLSIEERILRITGYYGFQSWSTTSRGSEHMIKVKGDVEACSDVDKGSLESDVKSRGQCGHCCLHLPSEYLLQAFLGLVGVLCVCFIWLSSTQLARIVVRQLNAPYTITWFSNCWNLLLFPLYLICLACSRKQRQSIPHLVRECCQFIGGEEMSLMVILARIIFFGVMWTLISFLYIEGLRGIPTSDASALFSCWHALFYMLSWTMLANLFKAIKFFGSISAIIGLLMITYADGLNFGCLYYIFMVIASAMLISIYKAVFQALFKSGKMGETAFFLTATGAANLVFFSILPVILISGREHLASSKETPWLCLCGLSALMMVFNFLIHCSFLGTLPKLISFGTVLSVPLNAFIDHYMWKVDINSARITSFFLLGLASVLLLLPEDLGERFEQLCLKWEQDKPHDGTKDPHKEPIHIPQRVDKTSH